MGRPKDTQSLSLAGPGSSPLPELEFLFIDQMEFSIPFAAIKIVDKKGCPIPGLWTKEDAVKKKYLDQINVVPVNVKFESQEVAVSQICFALKGRTSIGQLADMVHAKLELNPLAQLEFSMDERVLPFDKLLLNIYKESMSSDGIQLGCRFAVADDAEN